MAKLLSSISFVLAVMGFIVSAYAFIRFQGWREPIGDLMWYPIPFALAIGWLSLVVLRGRNSAALTGAAFGGSLVFAFCLARIAAMGAALSDGEVWWGEWFLAISFLSLPATLVGLIAGLAVAGVAKLVRSRS